MPIELLNYIPESLLQPKQAYNFLPESKLQNKPFKIRPIVEI